MEPAEHQVELIEAPIEAVPGDGVYDFIISGLPLNNFAPERFAAISALSCGYSSRRGR